MKVKRGSMPKYGRGATDAQTPPNRLKREAVYIPDRDGKVRISFTPKYVAAGGAGEGEENEYAQIWEWHISVARRCLGKGKAQDKLVLDSALWHVLCAEEEKAGVPMEVEEHGAGDGRKETFKIPCSSRENSGGERVQEEFKIETKHTLL